MRKQISSLLVLVLCVCAALGGTHVQVQAKAYKGKWRNTEGKKTINWQYDNRTNRLTISGRRKMDSGHPNDEAVPEQPGWKKFSDSIREIVIKEGVENAGEEMLGSAKNLTSIVLADSVKEIGSCAFGNDAKKLKKINLPPYLEKIGAFAFEYSGLTEITIPSSVKKIGTNAFCSCDDLRKVIIRPGLKKIGSMAFLYCFKLKEVILPEGLEVIGELCFEWCALKSVHLPKSLKKLKPRCFCGVPLQKVIIPENVQEIGKETFCTDTLRRVIIRSKKITHWGKDIFGEGSRDLVIEVPKSRLKEYRKQLYAKGLPKYVKVIAHKAKK